MISQEEYEAELEAIKAVARALSRARYEEEADRRQLRRGPPPRELQPGSIYDALDEELEEIRWRESKLFQLREFAENQRRLQS